MRGRKSRTTRRARRPEAEPERFDVFVMEPIAWKTAEDARGFLEDRLAPMLRALHDLEELRIALPNHALFDAAQLVELAAAFIRAPMPLEVGDERTGSTVTELARCFGALVEKAAAGDGISAQTAGGLGCELGAGSARVLGDLLASAATKVGCDGERRWKDCEKRRLDEYLSYRDEVRDEDRRDGRAA